MLNRISLALLVAALVLSGCEHFPGARQNEFSHFTGLEDFSNFTRSQNRRGETVWLSPPIQSPVAWNQLVVSWNAGTPAGTFLKIEAGAIYPDHTTKFYTLGRWSPDNRAFPRTSVSGQKDRDGDVSTDTLVMNRPAPAVLLRLTLGGTNGALPALKFIGLSFCNTKVVPAPLAPNQAAWGKTIAAPEHSQHGYPDEKGWCSPASLSMVLARWAEVLARPEMNLAVPEVAAKVYDRDFAGTGNWPFNTAFAGSFGDMRSYVTRLDDIPEVEDWIAAGIPVILSVRWDQLQPGRPFDRGGHLIVCIGFTKDGDLVINDPAARLDQGESVRRIYPRENVIRAWTKSHHAVYLVYPETAKIPRDRFGHWFAGRAE